MGCSSSSTNEKNCSSNHKKSNEINIIIKVNEKELNKEIFFLDNSDFDIPHSYLKEMNDTNTELYINDVYHKFQKSFKFEKEGEYTIKLKLKFLIKDCSYMFYECNNIIKIDLSNFDTSETTNMLAMFENCSNLVDINLANFDTSKTTNMYAMIEKCTNLVNINLTNFDTSETTNMGNMFAYCINLINLDLSSFDTSKTIKMSNMFLDCSNLVNINL